MPTPADGYAGDVTPMEAWDMLKSGGARLVDVRTRAEWGFVGVPDLSELAQQPVMVEWVGYPDGQLNPAFAAQLQEGLGQHPKDAPVVFLCRSGVRSIGAAKAATDIGYADSYNVLFGFEGPVDIAGHRGGAGWRADGLPWRQG